MSSAAIDACCLIDLLASGHVETILQSAGFDWYLPGAVEAEVQHVRQYDLTQPGQFLKIAVDLSPLKSSGTLKVCGTADKSEQDRFVYYATQFRSDGEAMCIALAEQRRWYVATDDRKAIRVARQAGLTVISCPELIKKWADTKNPGEAVLHQVLKDIQVLAQFKPNQSMPEFQWWMDELARVSP